VAINIDWLINAIGHTAAVERFTGQGTNGPVFAAATTERCYYQAGNEVIRTSDGREVISSGTCYFKASVADIPNESRITVGGRRSYAVVVNRRDAGALPTPNHVEVKLR